MRLKSLHIRNFRSIQGEVHVSLDSSIVLVHGLNGAGKTSLLSAIELALTGSIPSLARAEPDYLSYLVHKDCPYGEVRLEITDENGVSRTGNIRITKEGIEGDPLLVKADASWFSERSYLAQSTLGRLLEIYQHAEKKEQSPLTRFVKELLGLDRMDALIDGLHSAGNVARLKSPVPGYAETRDAIAARKKEVDDLQQRVRATRQVATDAETDLGDALLSFDPALAAYIDDLPELGSRLAQEPDEEEQRSLIQLRRELEVSVASWQQWLSKGPNSQHADIEVQDARARAAYADWLAAHRDEVQAAIAGANSAMLRPAPISDTSYGTQVASLEVQLSADTDAFRLMVEEHDLAKAHLEEAQRQLAVVTTRLARIEQQIADSALANEGLANALSSVATHVHGENCPVCDRDYRETGKGPLAAHLSAKVAEMVEHAGRLQALVRDRASTAATMAGLEQDVALAKSRLVREETISQHKAQLTELIEAAGVLNRLAATIAHGDALRGAAERTAQRLLEQQTADQSGLVLRASLRDLGRRLGQTDDLSDVGALTVAMVDVLEKRAEALDERQDLRKFARLKAGVLENARAKVDELKSALDVVQLDLGLLEERREAADVIIGSAKDLVRQTKEARASIVRKVFNDELNSVWRDLFVRLAPEEPFIPAFALPDSGSVEVEAVLETLHRRGGMGGNPRAMLSAGNLNTAALTLFLAIHLSSKARLPWLLIDDPVQSMDEVHIAQFAALLRTLSKQMDRQVIIAVHERSLFDYLSLELSPTFDGDRLNLVTLGRNAVGGTTGNWEPRAFIPDRAFAA